MGQLEQVKMWEEKEARSCAFAFGGLAATQPDASQAAGQSEPPATRCLRLWEEKRQDGIGWAPFGGASLVWASSSPWNPLFFQQVPSTAQAPVITYILEGNSALTRGPK